MNLRDFARGRNCQIRLPGVCNFNPETTVLAHVRLVGLSGMGMKVDDRIGAHACSACHAHVDSHKDAETQVSFYQGVFRTQQIVINHGLWESAT